MKLYADRPARVLSQLIGDLVVVIVGYLGIRLGLATHSRVAELAGPGRDAEATARKLDGQLRGAAGNIRDTPLVGNALASPFKALASTSRALAAQAQAYQDSVERLATLAGFLVAGVILVVLLVLWLPRRIGWIVEASAASRLVRRSDAGTDLLAVRALARQPLRVLARLDPAVVSGWRAGDPAAAGALAALELDELGLRLPPEVPGPQPLTAS